MEPKGMEGIPSTSEKSIGSGRWLVREPMLFSCRHSFPETEITIALNASFNHLIEPPLKSDSYNLKQENPY